VRGAARLGRALERAPGHFNDRKEPPGWSPW
jgi:hypothetical protein